MQEKLSPEAVRVLGALVEKAMSTPEYYPLTLNSIRTACNQKSNRHPVVSFGELDIMRALDELRALRLVGHVTGSGSRSEKFRHALVEAMDLSPPECAVLACLALRGSQTIGEIRGRTGRLYAFADMSEAESTVDGLCEGDAPLVVRLERGPGQKEARYAHLLSGAPVSDERSDLEDREPRSDDSGAGDETLRHDLVKLREELARLREDFDEFRRQFD